MPTSVKRSVARLRWPRRRSTRQAVSEGSRLCWYPPTRVWPVSGSTRPSPHCSMPTSTRSSARRHRPMLSPDLGEIVDAGVVACSPTASASLLDNFPDRNLFFRTIPSDSLQALAIGEAVDRTGASRATVAYIDDTYGQTVCRFDRGLFADKGHRTDSLRALFSRQPVDQDGSRKGCHAGRRRRGGDRRRDLRPGDAWRDRLRTSRRCSRSTWSTTRCVAPPPAPSRWAFRWRSGSRASRRSRTAPMRSSWPSSARRPTTRARTRPTHSTASTSSRWPPWPASRRSLQRSLQQIPAVSDSGTPCMTFADCSADIEAGSNINYDGPGGPVTINSKGDLGAAELRVLRIRRDRSRLQQGHRAACTPRSCSSTLRPA